MKKPSLFDLILEGAPFLVVLIFIGGLGFVAARGADDHSQRVVSQDHLFGEWTATEATIFADDNSFLYNVKLEGKLNLNTDGTFFTELNLAPGVLRLLLGNPSAVEPAMGFVPEVYTLDTNRKTVKFRYKDELLSSSTLSFELNYSLSEPPSGFVYILSFENSVAELAENFYDTLGLSDGQIRKEDLDRVKVRIVFTRTK